MKSEEFAAAVFFCSGFTILHYSLAVCQLMILHSSLFILHFQNLLLNIKMHQGQALRKGIATLAGLVAKALHLHTQLHIGGNIMGHPLPHGLAELALAVEVLPDMFEDRLRKGAAQLACSKLSEHSCRICILKCCRVDTLTIRSLFPSREDWCKNFSLHFLCILLI